MTHDRRRGPRAARAASRRSACEGVTTRMSLREASASERAVRKGSPFSGYVSQAFSPSRITGTTRAASGAALRIETRRATKSAAASRALHVAYENPMRSERTRSRKKIAGDATLASFQGRKRSARGRPRRTSASETGGDWKRTASSEADPRDAGLAEERERRLPRARLREATCPSGGSRSASRRSRGRARAASARPRGARNAARGGGVGERLLRDARIGEEREDRMVVRARRGLDVSAGERGLPGRDHVPEGAVCRSRSAFLSASEKPCPRFRRCTRRGSFRSSGLDHARWKRTTRSRRSPGEERVRCRRGP